MSEEKKQLALPLFPFEVESESNAIARDPLPLIVAKQWGFPLQYHRIQGETYFAVQDWIAGIGTTDTRKAGKLWGDMQNQMSVSIVPLNYLARDGKGYQRDYVTDEGLYQIVSHMRSTKKRPALQSIKEYLAKSGVIIDAIARDPQKAQAFVKQVEKRHGLESVSKLKRHVFTDALRDTYVGSNPPYAQATNVIYHKIARTITEEHAKDEICGILNLSEKESRTMRDFLNPLILSAVIMAEESSALKMREMKRQLSADEQINIVRFCAREVALTAWRLSDYAGVDLVTGQSLLRDKNA